MKREIILYGLVLALSAFLLEWIEFKYVTRVFSTEIYVVLIALSFTALGAWAGGRLTTRHRHEEFAVNAAALKSLGISKREQAVLELLAKGLSNKEMARDLGVSPNTVKTHLANLYDKLAVNRRVQAVQAARSLNLIP